MSKLLVGLLLGVSVLLTIPVGIKVVDKLITAKITEAAIDKTYAETKVPKPEDALKVDARVNLVENNKMTTLTLEDSNTVVFRGPVTESSVAKAMKDLQNKSRKLPNSTQIYLVLDSPGGSVSDGLDLIDFVNALPQKVNTITLFAASMAFQFAQNMDERLIIRNGTLMSHRASLNGLGGQIKGELETRYKMIRRKVDYLDHVASKRMGLTLPAYEQLIFNEYWVHGFDAVEEKAADKQVLLRCGTTMDGTEAMTFNTFFGPVKVTFSKCPLIRAPESIDFGNVRADSQNYVQYVFKLAIEDQKRFVQDFIVTDKFSSVFR